MTNKYTMKNEITIRNIKTFLTEPNNTRLVTVKIETSEPELYGVGDATFTQRPTAVYSAINDYLKPFLLGKSVYFEKGTKKVLSCSKFQQSRLRSFDCQNSLYFLYIISTKKHKTFSKKTN